MEQTMNSNMQPAKRGIKKSWIILGIVVVLVLWMFSGYNGLVEKQELATTELANVQTQYQRRADMMPQLAKIVKAYAKHEKETFAEVTKARAAVGQVKLDANNLTEASLKKYTAAQGELANAFSKLMVVAEKYPELKASENFKALQVQEEGTENRISEARRKYNEAVQNYNQTVRKMPSALIAGLFNFNVMPKFEAAALKNTDGVYYDVQAGLSYGDYDVETAADVLIEGVEEVLNK